MQFPRFLLTGACYLQRRGKAQSGRRSSKGESPTGTKAEEATTAAASRRKRESETAGRTGKTGRGETG